MRCGYPQCVEGTRCNALQPCRELPKYALSELQLAELSVDIPATSCGLDEDVCAEGVWIANGQVNGLARE